MTCLHCVSQIFCAINFHTQLMPQSPIQSFGTVSALLRPRYRTFDATWVIVPKIWYNGGKFRSLILLKRMKCDVDNAVLATQAYWILTTFASILETTFWRSGVEIVRKAIHCTLLKRSLYTQLREYNFLTYTCTPPKWSQGYISATRDNRLQYYI